jgi:glycerol-3-phosphate cytidylyltransferase-like family protein
MNTDKQRIAIAQACGVVSKDHWGHLYKTEQGYARDCPDYVYDLNAMHEAEKVLDYNQMNRYQNIELSRFVRTGTTWICRATSAERAEAFLRTLGKWEEDK